MARRPETPEGLKLSLPFRNEFYVRIAAVRTIIRDAESILLNARPSEPSLPRRDLRAADIVSHPSQPSARSFVKNPDVPRWSQNQFMRVHQRTVSYQFEQSVRTYQNWSTLETHNTNSAHNHKQHVYRSEASHTTNVYVQPHLGHENYLRQRNVRPVNVAVVPIPIVYVGWAPGSMMWQQQSAHCHRTPPQNMMVHAQCTGTQEAFGLQTKKSNHQNFFKQLPRSSGINCNDSAGFNVPPQDFTKNAWSCQNGFNKLSQAVPNNDSNTLKVSNYNISPQKPLTAPSKPTNSTLYPPQKLSNGDLNNQKYYSAQEPQCDPFDLKDLSVFDFLSPEIPISNSQKISVITQEPSDHDLDPNALPQEEQIKVSGRNSNCQESLSGLDTSNGFGLNASQEMKTKNVQNFSGLNNPSQEQPFLEHQNSTVFNTRSTEASANGGKVLLLKSSHEERPNIQIPDSLFNIPDKPLSEFDRQNIFAPDIPFEPKGPSIREYASRKDNSTVDRTTRNVDLILEQSRPPPGFIAASKNETGDIPPPKLNSVELNPDDFDDTGPKFCSFCHNNEMRPDDYLDHNLRTMNKYGINVLTCPILRSYVCLKCGATGDDAHTMTHCPVLIKELGRKPRSVANALKNTLRDASGRLRRNK